MEIELKKIIESEEYRVLQKKFDGSGCNRINLLGSVATICKESNATTIDEWLNYYLFKTNNFSKIGVAAKLLNNYDEVSKSYCFDTCYKCILAFVIYKTFYGCKMEIEAKKQLRSCKYFVRYAEKEEDNKYEIDLIVTRNNEVIYGIQVKPISYYFEHVKPNSIVHQINKAKNKKFKDLYHCNVKYLYYNENFEFDEDDIEKLKDDIKAVC